MNGEEIKALRLAKGLTQSELGELCGVDKASVSKWEKRKNNPSGGALKVLSMLAAGDLVVSQVSPLEVKLLDQNVEVGRFRNREDYLTASLKHLLVHGRFLTLDDAGRGPEFKAAEDPAPFKAREKPDGGGNG